MAEQQVEKDPMRPRSTSFDSSKKTSSLPALNTVPLDDIVEAEPPPLQNLNLSNRPMSLESVSANKDGNLASGMVLPDGTEIKTRIKLPSKKLDITSEEFTKKRQNSVFNFRTPKTDKGSLDRAKSFIATDDDTPNYTQNTLPKVKDKSFSVHHQLGKGKSVISGPTDLKHTELRAALANLTQAVPHRFQSYNFTSLKSPKCSLCGLGFKGIILKTYKCKDCQYVCHPRCLPAVPPDCGLKSERLNSLVIAAKTGKVFGVELAEQVQKEKEKKEKEKELKENKELKEKEKEEEVTGVPLIVISCIKAVEKRGLSVQGIYRVSGASTQTAKLKEIFAAGNLPDLGDSEWSDIGVVTSLLKLYLRELPTPVICVPNYTNLMDVMKLEDERERVLRLSDIIRALPEAHFKTLEYIILHLTKIDQHASETKMTSYNLSLLFGPTLIKAPSAMQNLDDMLVQAKLIEHLIVHFRKIFKNDYSEEEEKEANQEKSREKESEVDDEEEEGVEEENNDPLPQQDDEQGKNQGENLRENQGEGIKQEEQGENQGEGEKQGEETNLETKREQQGGEKQGEEHQQAQVENFENGMNV